MRVRPAEPADLDGLVESMAALFADDPGQRDPTADLAWARSDAGRVWLAATVADPNRLALVGVDEERVVAHLTGVLVEPTTMHMIVLADLRSIHVAATHRSSGVGSELVQQFRTWARDNGAQRLSVTAYASNDGALRFYRRHGFAPHEIMLTSDP